MFSISNVTPREFLLVQKLIEQIINIENLMDLNYLKNTEIKILDGTNLKACQNEIFLFQQQWYKLEIAKAKNFVYTKFPI